MKKITKIILISSIFFVIVFHVLNFSGNLGFLNQIINKVIPDIPDKSCKVDSDCALKVPSQLSKCLPCDPLGCRIYSAESDEVVAVNKNWRPRCLFYQRRRYCIACEGGISTFGYKAECINNTCVKVEIKNVTLQIAVREGYCTKEKIEKVNSAIEDIIGGENLSEIKVDEEKCVWIIPTTPKKVRESWIYFQLIKDIRINYTYPEDL